MKKGKVFLKGRMFPKISAFLIMMTMIFTLGACGSNPQETENMKADNKMNENVVSSSGTDENMEITDTAAL